MLVRSAGTCERSLNVKKMTNASKYSTLAYVEVRQRVVAQQVEVAGQRVQQRDHEVSSLVVRAVARPYARRDEQRRSEFLLVVLVQAALRVAVGEPSVLTLRPECTCELR